MNYPKTKSNSGAFPKEGGGGGLTTREYFAIMAFQGLLAQDRVDIDFAATKAVRAADALINALNEVE